MKPRWHRDSRASTKIQMSSEKPTRTVVATATERVDGRYDVAESLGAPIIDGGRLHKFIASFSSPRSIFSSVYRLEQGHGQTRKGVRKNYSYLITSCAQSDSHDSSEMAPVPVMELSRQSTETICGYSIIYTYS